MKLDRRLVALVVLSALLVGGCGRRPPSSIVLITIDTLRSDHLPVYGYRGVETPHLDALRRDSILYQAAYSPVPLTLPAHVSLLSGLLPNQHGVRDNVGFAVPVLEPWLPSLLRDRGYETGAIVSSFVLRGRTGLGRGFASFDDRLPRFAGDSIATVTRSGAESAERARGWLDGSRRRPFFLFLHLYDPHLPYSPPQPFAARYAARPYDGEIAAADQAVGTVIAELKRQGSYDDSLIIVTSDHGEGLGDHGEDEHGLLLYREALQVPLLVKLPGNERRDTAVAWPVQLVDVVPTIAELLGIQPATTLPGSSLLHAPAERALYAESYYPLRHFGWQPLRSVVLGDRHVIWSSKPEVYDLTQDPAEANDLRENSPSVLRQAVRWIRAADRQPLQGQEPSVEERGQLAALGYLSGTVDVGATDVETLPRPQDRILVLREIRQAIAALRAAQSAADEQAMDRAISLLDELVVEEPRIPDLWTSLAEAQMVRGRPAAAARAAQRAFEVGGRSPEQALVLAAAFERLALRALERSRFDEAAEVAERAVQLDAARANAWNHLAVARFELGDRQGALSAWRAALAADPELFDALFNVGWHAAELGSVAEATDALRRFIARAPASYRADLPRARAKLRQLTGRNGD